MIIKIKVTPNSSKTQITSFIDDILNVKLCTPPVDGKANGELIKFLSKQFKVPKTSIEILKGDKSKHKSIELPIEQEFFKEKITEILQ